MKKSLVFGVLAVAALAAAAQDVVGTVISSTPVIQQVSVPRQTCGQPIVVQAPQPSGVGGILGAIAGAAIGSQIGGGSGRGVATVVGGLGGAVLGNSVESNAGGPAQVVPQCTTETSYENRTVGYNVTYEYAGRQYTVQMPYDPGPTIRLQVTPVGAAGGSAPHADAGPATGPVVVAPPVGAATYTTAPAPVVMPAPPVYSTYAVPAYPVYPAYAPSYYRPYPPVGVSLGFVFSSGHRHHGHRHWR